MLVGIFCQRYELSSVCALLQSANLDLTHAPAVTDHLNVALIAPARPICTEHFVGRHAMDSCAISEIVYSYAADLFCL